MKNGVLRNFIRYGSRSANLFKTMTLEDVPCAAGDSYDWSVAHNLYQAEQVHHLLRRMFLPRVIHSSSCSRLIASQLKQRVAARPAMPPLGAVAGEAKLV
jgi:hypothetical protein